MTLHLCKFFHEDTANDSKRLLDKEIFAVGFFFGHSVEDAKFVYLGKSAD